MPDSGSRIADPGGRIPDLGSRVPDPGSRKKWAMVVLSGIAISAGVFIVSRWQSSAASDRLPPPPRLSAQQKVIEDHLHARYAAATDEPSSIAAVGPLCVAYHADMFFDEAERCYQLATTLAPDDWRWTYYRAVIQSERGGGQALVDNLREVVERAPQHGPAWLRLGEAEFKAGRYDEAAAAWQKARGVPAASPDTASPRHVTEVPLSVYASRPGARRTGPR